MTKKPSVGQSTLANGLLDLIHSNVCGPLNTQARGGFSYFITFINDHSRYGYVYLMWCKSETFGIFKEFRLEVETKLVAKLNLFDRTEMTVKHSAFKDCGPDAILDMARFVGYPKETAGYYFYDPSEQKVFVLRNAVFLEKHFEADTHCEELLLEESSEMDMKMAFLNEFVEEEIYMDQSEGFTSVGEEQKVCHLQRSIMVSNKLPGAGISILMRSYEVMISSRANLTFVYTTRVKWEIVRIGDQKANWIGLYVIVLTISVVDKGCQADLTVSREVIIWKPWRLGRYDSNFLVPLEDVVRTVGSKIEPVTYQYMTVESPISSEMVQALRACGHND
ncbi:Retrovirus-related Pol polyprotein from transposon TNT 1-94 [Sesamum angolense]|uniref:Retrovirus-related Pol polyprotein from transposon TNT 1-94 n=1 Tax=Sesamum angolense TaxID=2727404 RepID=A0AAE1T4S7_9LAMI|nr:Retrovirus-related Pol polyprotein from transposon TNT 1-94 [Sesamum angolense]